MTPLLLLRPQPGNDASAARAKAMGLAVIQAPLFEIVASSAKAPPAGPFDALLLTSANGVRFGHDLIAAHADLPLYAVGEATALPAREEGHADVIVGRGDAASTVPMILRDGHAQVLHICGEDVRDFDSLGITFVRHAVYRSAEVPEAAVRGTLEGLDETVAAIHSPRAGRRLNALLNADQRARIHVAAISEKAAKACGTGWASLTVSATPDDTALLACAQSLCIRAG